MPPHPREPFTFEDMDKLLDLLEQTRAMILKCEYSEPVGSSLHDVTRAAITAIDTIGPNLIAEPALNNWKVHAGLMPNRE